jgi:hypothetical protein
MTASGRVTSNGQFFIGSLMFPDAAGRGQIGPNGNSVATAPEVQCKEHGINLGRSGSSRTETNSRLQSLEPKEGKNEDI